MNPKCRCVLVAYDNPHCPHHDSAAMVSELLRHAEVERLRDENAELRIRVDELTSERDDLSARLHACDVFGGPW